MAAAAAAADAADNSTTGVVVPPGAANDNNNSRTNTTTAPTNTTASAEEKNRQGEEEEVVAPTDEVVVISKATPAPTAAATTAVVEEDDDALNAYLRQRYNVTDPNTDDRIYLKSNGILVYGRAVQDRYGVDPYCDEIVHEGAAIYFGTAEPRDVVVSGFARGAPWSVAGGSVLGADELRFALSSSPLLAYSSPFPFLPLPVLVCEFFPFFFFKTKFAFRTIIGR